MRAFILTLCISLAACDGSPGSDHSESSHSSSTPEIMEAQVKIVPLPAAVELKNETQTFGLIANVQFDPLNATSTEALQSLTASLGITHSAEAPYKIELALVTDSSLGEEGYSLNIEQDIVIHAQTDTGLFYGLQSLQQLFPPSAAANYTLPKLTITDTPQYAWRGSMIDVARNFFSIDYLKKHLDRMAFFKLNKLHLHLSDDQGWRVEIKAYPKLTEIGGSGGIGDSKGGFYTQDQLKELVAYAAKRHIEIIPELDMPGHTQAAIASYNELACDNVTNLGLYHGLDVGFSALCLTKPEVTYGFVQTVLSEITSIFPSEYLHIGGDEIKNPRYAEFITKANQIINGLDRKMIGWEEASAGEITPDSLLQLWNDDYNIQSAIDRNIHLILSPCSYTYLDHGNYNGQPNTYTWCRDAGIPLERVYSFNPTQFSLVVGVEGPVWTELVTTEADLDNRLWPRLGAIAEIAWTAQANRHYAQFVHRLGSLQAHLDQMQIHYYKEPQLGW